MIVVDASALLVVLLRIEEAWAVEQWMRRPGETLHAPQLLLLEVAQVIRRHAMRGAIDMRRGHQALADLLQLPLQLYPHDVLLRRAWSLRHNLTVYDATYVALAEALDAVLLTRDQRMAVAAGHQIRIEVV